MEFLDRIRFPAIQLPKAITKYPGGEQLALYARYAPTFKGRATRTEFFGTLLSVSILSFGLIALGPFSVLMDQPEELRSADTRLRIDWFIWLFVWAVPMLAVTVRRLHDTRRRWWALFVVLMPYVGWLVLFVILMLNSDKEENEFGPPPPD